MEAIIKFLDAKKKAGYPVSRISKELDISRHRIDNMRRGTTSSVNQEIYDKFKRKYPSAVKRLFSANPEAIVDLQSDSIIILMRKVNKLEKRVTAIEKRYTQ